MLTYSQLTHHEWTEYSAQLHRLGQLFLGSLHIPVAVSGACVPDPSGKRLQAWRIPAHAGLVRQGSPGLQAKAEIAVRPVGYSSSHSSSFTLRRLLCRTPSRLFLFDGVSLPRFPFGIRGPTPVCPPERPRFRGRGREEG